MHVPLFYLARDVRYFTRRCAHQFVLEPILEQQVTRVQVNMEEFIPEDHVDHYSHAFGDYEMVTVVVIFKI